MLRAATSGEYCHFILFGIDEVVPLQNHLRSERYHTIIAEMENGESSQLKIESRLHVGVS